MGLIDQPVNAVQSLTVEKIIYHSRYRPKGLDHDIALMKLVQPLSFNGTFCKRGSFKMESGSSEEPHWVTFISQASVMIDSYYANSLLVLSL